MKLRLKLLGLALGVVLLPPTLWLLVVNLAPTDWARRRVAACVATETGRATHLGALSLRTLGGVQLDDLRIYDPGQTDDPWLRVERMTIDLDLAHLLTGSLEPGEVQAEGVALRVHRRADGTFDLADLLGHRQPQADATGRTSGGRARPPVNLKLKRAEVTVVDEPSRTRLFFHDIESRGTWQDTHASIDELTGQVHGGQFVLTARLDRATAAPRFEGQISMRKVGLNSRMDVLTYLIPVLSGASATATGRLDLDLELRGRGDSAQTLSESLTGSGSIKLDQINLADSELVADLGRLLRTSAENHLGTFSSDFAIAQRRINSKEMTLTLGRMPLRLSGYTDFDGRVDYQVQTEEMAGTVSTDARQFLSALPLRVNKLMSFHVRGTIDRVALQIEGVPFSKEDGPEEPVKAEQLGRRLLDRIRR